MHTSTVTGFEQIVENCPDAILVVQDGVVAFANAAANTLLRRALLGVRILDVVEPSFREIVRTRIERTTLGLSNPPLPQKLIAGDGTVVDVEGSSTPIEFRGRAATAGVLRDIGARVVVESQLRAAEERFRLVLQATNDAVWDWDIVNRTVTWGHSPTEIGEMPPPNGTVRWYVDHLHEDDRETTIRSIKEAMASGTNFWSGSYRFAKGDGSYAQIVDRAYIVRDPRTNEPVRMIGAAMDVTQLRRATEENTNLANMLNQVQRVSGLGRLVATVAHEFNNVLMAIQPYAEIIDRKKSDPESVTKCSAAVKQAVKRGKRITEEILRFTRPSEPALATLNLKEWLGRFAQDLHAAEMGRVELSIVAPERDVWIRADLRQLEQMIWNLAVNGRDAMPDGGRLTIAVGECQQCASVRCSAPAEQRRGQVCIRVSDTGAGIPDDVQRRIFEPLFTTKRNGTGLGLAVVQQIASSHGGYVSVHSVVGKGTTFCCVFRTEEAPEIGTAQAASRRESVSC